MAASQEGSCDCGVIVDLSVRRVVCGTRTVSQEGMCSI